MGIVKFIVRFNKKKRKDTSRGRARSNERKEKKRKSSGALDRHDAAAVGISASNGFCRFTALIYYKRKVELKKKKKKYKTFDRRYFLFFV